MRDEPCSCTKRRPNILLNRETPNHVLEPTGAEGFVVRIAEETLLVIQRHFHDVIRGRAAELIDQHAIVLPELAPLLTTEEPLAWFPVSGMYGGFRYWLEGDGPDAKLVTESWCRVVDGSGQRHEIKVDGSRLVEEER